MSPHAKVRFSWGLIIASLVLWPLSALTVARNEPQVVLGLSWTAILFTGVTALFEAEVLVRQDEEES